MKSATVKTRRGIIFIEEKKVEKIPENNLKKTNKTNKTFDLFIRVLCVHTNPFGQCQFIYFLEFFLLYHTPVHY
jgi:hypothetical protein